MCQRWGTPSPLAGPLFRFLISSVVFFFPSQPGTSCRGNDNMRGKQQRLITSPPTYSRSQLACSLVSPFVRPKLVFFPTCGLFDLPPHFSICTSTRFIYRVVTRDPWNWYVTLSCTNSGGSHTCRFGFSLPFPLWTPSSLMHKESGLCSPTSSPKWLAGLGEWTHRTPPSQMYDVRPLWLNTIKR